MLRERISITLNPDLIKAVDQTVNGHSIRNRSHAIEVLIQEGLSVNQFHTAFFFIYPQTSQSQIESALLVCEKSNLNNLFFVIFPSEDQNQPNLSTSDLKYTLDNFQSTSNQQFNVQYLPSELGEAGTLLMKKDHLQSTFAIFHLNQTFSYQNSLWPAFSFHRKNGQYITTISSPLNLAPGTYANQGVSFFEPAILDLIKIEHKDLQRDFFAEILKAGKLVTYVDLI